MADETLGDMADLDDVRRIAESLPQGTFEVDDEGRAGASVEGVGFAWTWMRRIDPKQPKVPDLDVLTVRVAGAGAKEDLLAADERKFFTEPHYNGFPAVLVRLEAVDVDELRELMTDAWRCKASKRLVRASGL